MLIVATEPFYIIRLFFMESQRLSLPQIQYSTIRFSTTVVRLLEFSGECSGWECWTLRRCVTLTVFFRRTLEWMQFSMRPG